MKAFALALLYIFIIKSYAQDVEQKKMIDLKKVAFDFINSDNKLELLKNINTEVCEIHTDCPPYVKQRYLKEFTDYLDGLFIEKDSNLNCNMIILNKDTSDRILVHEYLHAYINYHHGPTDTENEKNLLKLNDLREDIHEKEQKIDQMSEEELIKLSNEIEHYFDLYIKLTSRSELEEIQIETALGFLNKSEKDKFYLKKNCHRRNSFFYYLKTRNPKIIKKEFNLKIEKAYQETFKKYCE